jgi:inner membrane protein
LDPLTQGTLAATFAQAAAKPEKIRAFAAAGAVAGMAPDLDILIRSATDPILYLEFHRQFSHSLLFIPVGAGLCALILLPLLKRWLSAREVFLAALLGYATHGLLDACTSYGTQLFWPLSDVRVAWNLISVVDPLFTLPLVGLMTAAAWRRKRHLAVAGLVWVLLYLSIAMVQQQRALQTARIVADFRGHEPAALTVKPGFANLLLWKAIYRAEGRIHVDGIRVTDRSALCPGASIPLFRPQQDLPWLDPESQQARDIDRFRWYSAGWLALDPENPNYLVDVRYASLPNRIEALWGLMLDPAADSMTHSRWHVIRSRRSENLDQLMDLLRGKDCRSVSSDFH